MPVHDFGTVRVMRGDDFMEVSFPYSRTMTSLMKKFNGRWNPTRRVWELKTKFAKCSTLQMTGEIEAHLLESAPEGWGDVLSSLGGLVCVSGAAEIWPGAGGIRVVVPPGHPGEAVMERLKSDRKVTRDGRAWLVDAAYCTEKAFRDLLLRLVKEDQRQYGRWLEPVVGRTIEGLVSVSRSDLEDGGFRTGVTAFASIGFLRVTDPKAAEMPLKEVPLAVERLDSQGDQGSLKLRYMPLAAGYDAMKEHLTNGDADPVLPSSFATEVWKPSFA